MKSHDVPVDYIITAQNIIKTQTSYQKPNGIDWEILGDKLNEIPVLQKLKMNKNRLRLIKN